MRPLLFFAVRQGLSSMAGGEVFLPQTEFYRGRAVRVPDEFIASGTLALLMTTKKP